MVDPAIVRGITSSLEADNITSNPPLEKNITSSFFKKTSLGTKVIRIEIYDAVQFSSVEKSFCPCNARICTQHVVEDEMTDNIYHRVRDIIKCIENNFYTTL